MSKAMQTIPVRFPPSEIREIRKVARDAGGTVSDFIRFCVSAQMAQSGENDKLIVDMISKGMKETINRMVEREIKKQTE